MDRIRDRSLVNSVMLYYSCNTKSDISTKSDFKSFRDNYHNTCRNHGDLCLPYIPYHTDSGLNFLPESYPGFLGEITYNLALVPIPYCNYHKPVPSMDDSKRHGN